MKATYIRSCVLAIALGFSASAALQADTRSSKLRKEIAALAVADVVWRQIPWKSCLLDGILESRRTKKPMIVWCFIDRPVDDTRC